MRMVFCLSDKTFFLRRAVLRGAQRSADLDSPGAPEEYEIAMYENAVVAQAEQELVQKLMKEAFVGDTEESCVDPLVHGLEDGDVRHGGRRAKVAPLHAGM